MELKYFLYLYLVVGFLTILIKPLSLAIKDLFDSVFLTEIENTKEIYLKLFLGLLFSVLFVILICLYLFLYPVIFLIKFVSYTEERKRKKIHDNKRQKIEDKYKDYKPSFSQKIESNNKFGVSKNQIIYLENDFNSFLNSYFQKHYQEISKIFKDKGYEFIYIPELIRRTYNEFPKIEKNLYYHFPYFTSVDLDNFQAEIENVTTNSVTKTILKSLNYSGDVYSGFFRFRGEGQFSYRKLDATNKIELLKSIWHYLDNLRDNRVYYSIVLEHHLMQGGKTDELSDFSFNYEAHKVSEEIKEKIKLLKKEGYFQLFLNAVEESLNDRKLANQSENTIENDTHKLSRLHINSNFDIFLPDFKNQNIKMTPLPKTVFIFFLRHPEGIILKHLYDYREELIEIYKQLYYRENPDEIYKNIDELVNPTKNSINEKCSRIKESFIKHFDESIASNYYITGRRGEKKNIRLNRDLIIWDFDENFLPSKTSSKTTREIENSEKLQDEYFEKGKDFFNNNEFKGSILYFTNIIELNPYHYRAYMYRAVCYFQIGKYDEAIEDNTKAIELNKLADNPYHNRAEVYLITKDYKKALSDIDYYIKKYDNKCKNSYFMRGLIKIELNDIHGACQDWYNAHSLKHGKAKGYLKKYSHIKITKQLFG